MKIQPDRATPPGPSNEFSGLLDCYRRTLLDEVVPFWMKHGPDAKGGFNTCLAEDGSIRSREKWNWSQWRAVWVFSRLYNTVSPRPEWLDIASDIYRFATSNGPLPSGHWPLLLDEGGRQLRGFESVYVDGYAIYGLVEYWRASRKDEALELAGATARAVQQTLTESGPLPRFPLTVPPDVRPHADSMLFSYVLHELAQASGDDAIQKAALRHHFDVMHRFLHKDRGLILEWLDMDYKECKASWRAAVCPGHALESLWFQIHVAQETGDGAVIDLAVDAIQRHLKNGWDEEQGGLFQATVADGQQRPATGPDAMKPLWVQVEALIATLMAYQCSRESWCLQWHRRIHDYCFSHYPTETKGSWAQRLDSSGSPSGSQTPIPVMDPFHLSRALMLQIEMLQQLLSESSAQTPAELNRASDPA